MHASPQTGWTSLHYACKYQHHEAATALVEAGANVNPPMCPKLGGPPLLVAVEQVQHETVKMLLDHGADVAAVDDVRCMCQVSYVCAACIVIQDGWTALHIAANAGNEDLCMLLLGCGAPVNATTPQGETSLHMAVGQRHAGVVNQLLSRQNVQVNPVCEVRDRRWMGCQQTPTISPRPMCLLRPTAQGHKSCRSAAAGATTCVATTCSQVACTPAQLAIWQGDAVCARMLLERGGLLATADYAAAHLAAMLGNLDVMKVVVDRIAMDMTAQDKVCDNNIVPACTTQLIVTVWVYATPLGLHKRTSQNCRPAAQQGGAPKETLQPVA